MATRYGLAISAPFVKGTAGSSFETLRRNYNKDKLINVACSLGWLVRDTLGIDVFRACLNLVESSPACGGGMERLARAYKLDRLGPYKEKALNAASLSSEEFVAHMARHGLRPDGEPLSSRSAEEDEEEAAAAAAALAADSQRLLLTQEGREDSLFSQDPGLSLFDPDSTPVVPAGQGGRSQVRGPEAGDDDEGKVSAPITTDDHARVGIVDDPDPAATVGDGNVRAPAATDPLVDAGSTLGRRGAAQSQVQAGSQVQDPAEEVKKTLQRRRKICASIRSNTFCKDQNCNKEHPPRCGDPRCYPRWRKSCHLWHDKAAGSQGNGLGVDPGRASHPQPQGGGPQQQRPHQHRAGQPQQQQQKHQGGQQQQQWRKRPGRHPRPKEQQQQKQQSQSQLRQGHPLPQRQWRQDQQRQQQHQRLPSLLPPPRLPLPPPQLPPLYWQDWRWQQLPEQLRQLHWQEQGARPTYRDVVKSGGATVQHLPVQDQLLGRLAALEARLVALTGPCRS